MKRLFLVFILLAIAWNFNFGQDFTPPVNISHNTDNNRWVQVAMGPLGEVYVCWEQDYQGQAGSDIIVKTYDGIKWSDPINLKNSPSIPSQRPSIFCNNKGVVAVIWGEGEPSHTKVRVYDPLQKKWLPAFQLSQDAIKGVVEQVVAVDPEGNIYTAWAGKGEGRVFSRSRINGRWESIQRLDAGNLAEHPVMAAGKDGWVWAIFRQRVPPERKVFYSKRKHNTSWTKAKYLWEGGSSQGHPGVTVGPDNIPLVAYCAETSGNNVMVFLVKLVEGNPTRTEIFPDGLQHDPRVAVDAFGNKHVAIQFGGGDYGIGVKYRNNMEGSWSEIRTLPNSCCGVKLPGISADPFGNVSIVWGASGQAWFTSLYPVQTKKLDPPINLSASLAFTPNPTYKLNWETNPENTTSFVKGYNLYKKESSDSDFVQILSVSKTTLTASFTYPEIKPGIEYGIATLSTSGTESDRVNFQIVTPPINPPANTSVKVILKSVKQATEVTYALSWQAHPQNSAKYIKSYKIYKKEGTGDFVLFQTLSNSTFSLTYTNTNPQIRMTFAISTVSALDTESTQVVFGM